MRKTTLLLPAALLDILLPSAVAATEAPAPTTLRLTLAEAIARARQSSPRLAQLRSLETAAAEGLRAARAGRLPQLDLSASYNRNSNVPELVLALPGAPPRTIFPNIPDTYRAHGGMSLPLYTGGRVENGISAADQQRLAAGKDVEGGLEDLVVETSTAYWSLVTGQQSARVLAESVASFEAHLKDARNRLDLGMAARNEVLAFQVERDRAELARLQSANAAEVANANLLRLLGLPPATRIEPVEPMAVPTVSSEEPEPLVAAALQKRPEVAALHARIGAAEANVKVARAGSLPQVGLSAGYDYANPNTRILPLAPEWKSTWSVGVSVGLTAFDGGRTSAAVAQARAQAEAARQQLEDLRRRVRLEVTSRVLEMATARAQVEVAERNLEAAKENVRVSRDRYHEGVIPSSELLDAETALLRAGLDRTAAATQVHVALANLDRAVGR